MEGEHIIMGFCSTKYYVEKILDALGGIPEECSWIDYKLKCMFDKDSKNKIRKSVVAFLNSIQMFDQNKYIVFGILENKKTKEKKIVGLEDNFFPDDNEWQDVFAKIEPKCPYVETGTLRYKGVLLGYICIFAQNYNGPYYCRENGQDIYQIRRSATTDKMKDVEKRELNSKCGDVLQKGRIYLKSDILNLLVTIGQYNSKNQSDLAFIESRTGKTYDEVKTYCMKMDNLFMQDKKSIYGLGDSVTVSVQEKDKRLLQFTSDEVFSAVEVVGSLLGDENSIYSHELMKGIADTLIFFANHGFSFYTDQMITAVVKLDMLRRNRYYAFSQLAEVSPVFFLKLITEYKTELLAEWQSKANAIQVLRTIVWYPEYYEEAAKLLIEFQDQSVYELFMCTELASAACFEQKLELLRELAKNDESLAFDIISRILDYNPQMSRVFSHTYVPARYSRFRENTHRLQFGQLQIYYSMLIDLAGRDSERIIKLLPPWLKPYPFSNLQQLVDCIEKAEPFITDDDERMNLWNRLCNTPLVYVTEQSVEGVLKQRLIAVGNKFKPDDMVRQSKQWFRKGIRDELSIDGSDRDVIGEKVDKEQKKVLLTICKKYGIREMISFIQAVEIEASQLAKMLLSPEFALTIKEDNAIATAFFECPEKYGTYLQKKAYTEKLEWIKSIDINDRNPNERAEFFATLIPDIKSIKYFEEVLGENGRLYWEKIASNQFSDIESIRYGFDKFIQYEMPQKAFALLNSIQMSQIGAEVSQWLFQALIKQEEYDESYLSEIAYEAAYKFLYNKIDENMIERMEYLSFRLYGKIAYYIQGYAGLKPLVTFRRIVNEPVFFMEMINGILNEPFGIEEHIMRNCDQNPENPIDWVNGINILMDKDVEKAKEKAEYWIGQILYNTLKTSLDGDYEIADDIARLLEDSERRRIGFFYHAYFCTNGVHVNGSYKYDSKDRKEAERYRKLADVQTKKGNVELSKLFCKLADQLLEGVESVQVFENNGN